jgi:hypothetical protein
VQLTHLGVTFVNLNSFMHNVPAETRNLRAINKNAIMEPCVNMWAVCTTSDAALVRQKCN